MKESRFFEQVKLILEILPLIAEEDSFALKGGTAINLFVRNMPRLSVDIDLAYIPLEDRETTLSTINLCLEKIRDRILNSFPDVRIKPIYLAKPKTLTKILVERANTQIKIETNYILRGSVHPPVMLDSSQKVEEMFGIFVSMRSLSLPDLYGGKICAALDRQHPRDLFDIKILLENEGITDEIRKAFVVYLAGCNRPMNELLNPIELNIEALFESDFLDMTSEQVAYEELVLARKKLIGTIRKELTTKEREFLLSIKQGTPKWELIEVENIEKFPAIQWKLMNIRKMGKQKHREALDKLIHSLEM